MLDSSKEKLEALSRLVNDTSFYPKELAEGFSHEHRYLQQEMFKFCYEYVRKLAAAKKLGRYDARNEWACGMAEKMIEGLGPDFAILKSELDERSNWL